ncbi:MAG: hypothetical protein NTZ90_15025 [Proteobacteria bacterium]|nr:hypothetical protein [Pseudomonadota bacterium]
MEQVLGHIMLNKASHLLVMALSIISSAADAQLSSVPVSSPPQLQTSLQYGQIGVAQVKSQIALKVVLQPFTTGLLANDLVHFDPLPGNLVPDEHGCLCFPVDDDRFAFVHAYYYATAVIEDYNILLSELNLPTVKDVLIRLKKDQSNPGDDSAHGNIIDATFYRPAFDYTTLGHEVGHIIHFALKGPPGPEPEAPTSMEVDAEQQGIGEGTANLLSALHFGNPVVQSLDAFDAPVQSIDTFVRYPDAMISTRQMMEGLRDAAVFSSHFPQFHQSIVDTLSSSDPAVKNYIALPDPYLSSSIINQPLWHAANRFGVRPVKLLYLAAIADLRTYTHYNDLAKKLLEKASPEIRAFLENEFVLRGLLAQ